MGLQVQGKGSDGNTKQISITSVSEHNVSRILLLPRDYVWDIHQPRPEFMFVPESYAHYLKLKIHSEDVEFAPAENSDDDDQTDSGDDGTKRSSYAVLKK